jgi:AcrR family transcriptional regulator
VSETAIHRPDGPIWAFDPGWALAASVPWPNVADSRRDLIEAGLALVIDQRWQDLQAAVSTRAITERAGVTTGSFFHHFRNRAHFAEVLADEFVALWDANVRRVLAEVEGLAAVGGADGVRASASSEWAVLDGNHPMAGLQRLLWVVRDQPLSDDSDVLAGTVLGDAYRSLTETLQPAYDRVLDALRREPLPPFTSTDLAVVLTALADGLQMRGAVDCDGIRDGLYVDIVTAIVISITRPLTERAERTELSALEIELGARGDGPADLDLDDDPAAGETWRQIADAAAPLFAGRAVDEVRVADVAEAAGVSTSTVYHHFGTIAAVAAAGWARHLPELEAISARPLTATEGPVARIEQVLTRFVELGRENRAMLEGFVLESLAAAGPAGSRSRRWPTERPYPFQRLVVPHLRELRARGLLRRRIDAEVLAATMVNIAASRALLGADEPVERIVDDSVELLLQGALARPGE